MNCRSCHAAVLWAVESKSRRRMPLDVDSVPVDTAGARVFVPTSLGVGWAYSLADLVDRLAAREGVTPEQALAAVQRRYTAHLSHFATCPSAAAHRSPR